MSMGCRPIVDCGATVDAMDFQVLGPVAVCTPAGHVDAGPLRQRAVLAALLVDCGQPVPVDVLVERVWGTDAPERAARTLHTYITRVRRVVEPAHLDRRPDGYLLRVDPDRVDLHRFHRLVRQAADASGDEVRRLDLLREAVGLWRGQPLAGIDGEWAARMRRS